MKISEILTKAAKGEALSDDEKASLAGYDPDKAASDAAAAARRKAEAERDAAKADLEALKAKAAEDGEKGKTGMEKLQDTIGRLSAKVEALTKAKADAEASAAAVRRSQGIRDAAKAAGIALAPKSVSEALFYQMLEARLAGVDVADADALKGALDAFKAENPGIIAAPGGGTGGAGGSPDGGRPARNPFAKESFNLTEQVGLLNTNPGLAAEMAAQAGNAT